MSTTLRWALVALLSSIALAGRPGCLPYEPEQVVIEGKLVRKTFPGLPNFESIKDGDAAETGFYLVLPHPLCTSDPGHTDPNGPVEGARLVQLVLMDQGIYDQLRPMLGKSVKLRGGLFSAITGHHHAPLLLTFKEVVP